LRSMGRPRKAKQGRTVGSQATGFLLILQRIQRGTFRPNQKRLQITREMSQLLEGNRLQKVRRQECSQFLGQERAEAGGLAGAVRRWLVAELGQVRQGFAAASVRIPG